VDRARRDVRPRHRRGSPSRHVPRGRRRTRRASSSTPDRAINGLYGIEDAKGNINYYNSGTLFGAIDVALFILVIGGFLGVTMKTGAIQAGIGTLVRRLEGKERLMIRR
jgi:uncharacterized ion transporter superfamily protein YfcC